MWSHPMGTEERLFTMMMKDVKPKKVYDFIQHLQHGGKAKFEGLTYVWLDNHVTQVIRGTEYGIDGLAIEMESINLETKETKPHYQGCFDMQYGYFLKIAMGAELV
jgi:hypothetical protein